MKLSNLPSVTALVEAVGRETGLPHSVVVNVCQGAIAISREAILGGSSIDPETTARQQLANIEAARPRAVINATGVLLHTNLGRAPLNSEVTDSMTATAASASNVEINLQTGRRSHRSTYLGTLLPLISGAEAGLAVNNNAGALLLALASVAGSGGEVAVSRGELIEIGGSFRLPELMSASGATLVEVGTTNRTRLADYEAVVGSLSAILKVHPSNYRVEGFWEDASYQDLAALAHENGIPFIADIGSGLIDESAPWLAGADRRWLAGEPGVIQTVKAGADLVLFSGDKLWGGPQAGILVGTAHAIERVAIHPIARALRLDAPTIAGISATCEMYAEHRVLEIPFWAMAAASLDDIGTRAEAVLADLPHALSIVDGESLPGAGSVPGATIPSRLIEIPGRADAVWAELAAHTPPVVASRRNTSVFIDLRSVLPSNDADVAAALRSMVI